MLRIDFERAVKMRFDESHGYSRIGPMIQIPVISANYSPRYRPHRIIGVRALFDSADARNLEYSFADKQIIDVSSVIVGTHEKRNSRGGSHRYYIDSVTVASPSPLINKRAIGYLRPLGLQR